MAPPFDLRPGPPAAILIFAGVLATAAALRRRTPGPRARLALAGGLPLALAALPFFLPPSALVGRVLFAGFAIAVGTKIVTLLLGPGPRDPGARASASRFLLWLLVPPELGFSSRDAAGGGRRGAVRRRGLRRLARVPLKAALLAALVAARAAVGRDAPGAWLILPLEFYLFLSALADAVTGAVMCAGVDADETFRRPLLARSPGDFWGRRWNLYIGGFLRRHVFAPLARRGRPHIALLASFAASGLLHEYLVAALLGPSRHRFGFMFAFFALQAAAVLSGHLLGAWALRPRPLAVAAQLVWIFATAPLFFAPLAPAVARFEEAIAAAIAPLSGAAPRASTPHL